MNQKACPKCGLVSEEKQYICPYCFFNFVVNPSSSKKSRVRVKKIKEEMIRKELEEQEAKHSERP